MSGKKIFLLTSSLWKVSVLIVGKEQCVSLLSSWPLIYISHSALWNMVKVTLICLQEPYRYGTEGFGSVDMVVMGWELDRMKLVGFSNLVFSSLLTSFSSWQPPFLTFPFLNLSRSDCLDSKHHHTAPCCICLHMPDTAGDAVCIPQCTCPK